jgi:hypothetical protein
VDIIKGYREDAAAIPQAVYPDENGIIVVEIKELERIEIHFPASPVNSLSPLPIGPTLDTGMKNRKDIIVNITPGY